jgi:phosphoglucosamine mutase
MPDNGIKLFTGGGGKLDDSLEAAIEARLHEPWERPTGRNVGRILSDDSAIEKYIKNLLQSVEIQLNGLKIVVDCANGASSFTAPETYRRAGAEVIAISNQPDGWNINDNCGSTHMESLRAKVLETGADIGIAHDGDADRCLMIDADGNYIDGDQILAILAVSMKFRSLLKENCVVATVMSNLGFIKAMREADIELITTPVGDRYILEKLVESDLSLGGEQSGHIILKQFANTGDGVLTALQVMQEVKRSGKSLGDLAAVMTRYPQVLLNIKDVKKERLSTSVVISEAVRAAEVELGDTGRVLIRISGTEPLVRVMVEAASDNVASAIATSLAEVVQQELR